MGLFKFWSTFTGPRIKEITPQEKCKWLENPRPTTSNGLRFKKGNISSPNLSEPAAGERQIISGDDKSSIFGKSKRRGWKRRKSLSGIIEPTAQDIPQPPVLVADVQPWKQEEPATHEETTRPGTAITTEQAAWNEVFELAADEVVLVKPEDEVQLPDPLNTRKRSKSSASERPRQKRTSWFSISRRRMDEELPPLPTSDSEPHLPTDAGAIGVQGLPASKQAPVIPAAQGFRDSLGAESILQAFPLVPSPAAEDTTFSKSTLHDSAIVTSPKKRFQGTVEIYKPLTSPKSFSQPKSPMLAPDGWPRPPSNSSNLRNSHRRGASESAKRSHHSSDEGFLSAEQQREYNRVTKFLEGMEQKNTSGGIVRVVTEFDAMPEPHRKSAPAQGPVEKYSNDQALAALQFGIVET